MTFCGRRHPGCHIGPIAALQSAITNLESTNSCRFRLRDWMKEALFILELRTEMPMSLRLTSPFLIVLGILSLIAILIPQLGIIALLTIVGVPIAYAYWALPGLFLWSLLIVACDKILPFKGMISLIFSFFIALAVSFLGATAINKRIHDDVNELTKWDINSVSLPLNTRVVAYQSAERGCTAFCVNALLAGAVDRFLVVPWDITAPDVLPDTDATSFQLERRSQCPAFKFSGSSNNRHLDLYPSKPGNETSTSVAELLSFEIAQGNCLIEMPAKLHEADLVIMRGRIREGQKVRDLGFGTGRNAITADRVSVKLKDPNTNDYTEIFRETNGQYAEVSQPLFSGPNFGNGFDVAIGWNWQERFFNRKRFPSAITWPDILTQTLGFDFSMSPVKASDATIPGDVLAETPNPGIYHRESLQELMQGVIKTGQLPTEAQWSALSIYWERLNLTHLNSDIGTTPDDQDIEIGLALLENPELPIPPRLSSFVQYLRRNAIVADENLAAMFLSRLEQTKEWSKQEELRTLGIHLVRAEIDKLPNQALLGFYDRMLRVAGHPLAYGNNAPFLSKFYLFGSDGIPPLLEIVEDGLETSNHYKFLAGSLGLCHLGPLVGPFRDELIAHINTSKMGWPNTLSPIMVRTLINAGLTAESLWPLLDKKTFRSMEKDQLDQLFARAAGSGKTSCN